MDRRLRIAFLIFLAAPSVFFFLGSCSAPKIVGKVLLFSIATIFMIVALFVASLFKRGRPAGIYSLYSSHIYRLLSVTKTSNNMHLYVLETGKNEVFLVLDKSPFGAVTPCYVTVEETKDSEEAIVPVPCCNK